MNAPGVNIVYPALNKDGKRMFPDGELYMKIPRPERVSGKRVVVLHAGAPFQNEGLMELELICQILKEAKARSVEIFFTYFPYGMQDSVFSSGETNAAAMLIEKLTKHYSIKKIHIIDAHFAGKPWTSRYPLHLISALPLLTERARRDWGNELLFLSPDKGGKRRTDFQNLKKKRKNSYEVEIHSAKRLEGKIKNRTIAVVDDIVETGGTLLRFHEECKRLGAKDAIALITHGLLQEGLTRVANTYSKLYLTNTINRSEANVDIIPCITQSLEDELCMR